MSSAATVFQTLNLIAIACAPSPAAPPLAAAG
jgi:hypothetical protein